MISPQLHPDSSTSRPPAPAATRFNAPMEHRTSSPDEQHLAVAVGTAPRPATDAVVNGLWHCLLGSLVAGIGVSAALALLVLALSHIA